MTLQQLIYFRAIGQCENFHKAAETLHVSQPCLSSAISKLEAELDLHLFDRKGRYVELTKLGKYYLKRISSSLDALEKATADVKKLASSTHGHVDVAFCVPLARELIPNLVRDFLELAENEKITFDFAQLTTPQIIQGMKDDRFDVGFCTEFDESALTFVPISRQELVVIVPRGHPLTAQERVRPADLVPYPNITYIRESGTHRLISERFAEEMTDTQVAYTAHDEDSIAALVSAGFGVAIVANVNSLSHAGVEIRPLDHPDSTFNITMVYPPNQYTPPAVKRFIQFAQTRLITSSADS